MEKIKETRKLLPLTIVTGNKNKLSEFQALLNDLIDLTSIDYYLPEFQGEDEEIAREKVLLAYNTLKKPLITEDTSLCFNALKGLPGPYIKWFLDKLGHDGLNKMLSAQEDKSAIAQCIIGQMGPELKEPKIFIGRTTGKIVPPRGAKNFGWDPIFEEDSLKMTQAEMGKEQKNKLSHRYKAVMKLREYFALK